MTPLPRLSVRNIAKRFGNTVALDGVDVDVREGEIVGLVGENGAGKSTLAKILAGIHQPDTGLITFEGHQRVIRGVRAAQEMGIAVVHQELNLVPHLDIESNILLGREPVALRGIGVEDKRKLRHRALEMLDRVGLQADPSTLVMRLSIAQQQRVEIAKALSLNARLLIMDEPTSSLPVADANALLNTLADLRGQGISIIYISHKLDEVCRLSDRIVVFRDGEKVAQWVAAQTTQDELVTAMVGRALSTVFPDRTPQAGPPVLQVQGVRGPGLAAPVSFEVGAAEVLGIAGLVGAGRSELLRTVFGASPRTAGQVLIAGRRIPGGNPRAAMDAGVGFVPEDRKTEGLILPMTVRDNMALSVLSRLARFMVRAPRREAELAGRFIRRLSIQAASDLHPVVSLSGGNQQKVLLAKWLAIEPKALLLDEPTRGIDVGAKQEVYRLITQIARAGVAVVVVSSEMEEIIGLSDRALVMNTGRVAGELSRQDLSEESIMGLAAHHGNANVQSTPDGETSGEGAG